MNCSRSSAATTTIVWATSGRLTNASAARSQTARPSMLAKTFFSLSAKRDDLPAAGRMTATRVMGDPSWATDAGGHHRKRGFSQRRKERKEKTGELLNSSCLLFALFAPLRET